MFENLTIEEKIGQMLMFGINSSNIEPICNLIKNYKIGGVILYKKNYSSYKEMLEVIKKLKDANKDNKLPLFIAIDQEGGVVNRLPNDIENIKNIYDVSKKDNIDLIKEHADIISNILYNSEINMNFSPVLDIYNNSNSSVLNKRCFSDDVEKVSSYGSIYMNEIKKNGIIPVVKHFPGHGITKLDSHYFLPYVFNYEKVLNREIIPFEKVISEGCDAIMISHLIIRKLSGLLPCSISKKFITKYLRERYNYNGLVITDDLRMKLVDLIYGKISLKKAFLSGSDVILLKYKENDEKIFNMLYKYANSKKIIDNINECVLRIINIKERYKISNSVYFDNLEFDNINYDIKKFNDII
ncbi:MAG: hypothetical protein MR550_00175 [Bacilli bacterium]|nr:hypothetical protein [Bacilli bacterium]